MAKSKGTEISIQIFELVKQMKNKWEPDFFFKELMSIYGTSESQIERALQNDRAVNVASELIDETMYRSDLAIRQRIYFRFLKCEEDVAPSLEKVLALKELNNQQNRFQFIICCSEGALCLYDLIKNNSLSIDIEDLSDNYSFLLPLKEGRKEKIVSSKEADKKACLKLTLLLDTLAKHNQVEPKNMTKLNSFIRRLLFCFFAEDTQIFHPTEENMFTNVFDKLVDKRGTNAKTFFSELFTMLNTKPEEREQFRHKFAKELFDFPYVNGGLFRDIGYIPDFDINTRNQFIDCGRLSWKQISPAIFGAMFQGAMNKEDRRSMGAHYTSEENILKVIKPLFLDNLYAEFEELKRKSAHLRIEIDNLSFQL